MQALFSPSLEECFVPCFHYCFSVAISIQLQLFLLFFTPEYFNLINYTNNSCKEALKFIMSNFHNHLG